MINKVKILKWLTKGNKKWYERDIDSSLEYVKSFKEPKSLWQRSYYQFMCYRYDVPVWKRLAYSLGAIVLLPFSILYFRFSHLRAKFVKEVYCVGDCSDVPNMLPESLKNQYDINTDVYYAGYGLSHSDMMYLMRNATRYFYSPSFVLHVLFKIAAYSNIFYKYRPSVMVCHNEYSYSSSALTDYCRFHHVLHINFMHGERLINIRNAFFEYDKCYVWHEHYKNIYLDMRSGTKPEDFIIELPKDLSINVAESFSKEAYADYKYYLAEVGYEEMKSIVTSMVPLKEKGYTIKFRPHPRYTNTSWLKELVSPDDIEDPHTTRINTSIASCKYVVGSYSTVMLQAYLCGIGVLVDDITYKDRIELQKKAKHIVLSVEGPELLSKHIEQLFTL